jgi:hypothetical protein
MSLSRRLVVWFAILAALLVVSAAPASAATGRMVNTTDVDFGQASLSTGLSISGSGEQASVTGSVGQSTVTTGSNPSTFTSGKQAGLYFEPNNDFSELVVELSPETSGITEVWLKEDGSFADIIQTSNKVVTFNYNFQTGNEYQVYTRANGQDYTNTEYSFSGTISGNDLDITDGYYDLSRDSTKVYNIEKLTSGQDTASYTGSAHDGRAQTLFANLSLVNANAKITAQSYDGSQWSDYDSKTVTTSGTHSIDVSSSTATKWRTVVEFGDEAGSSTVELFEEGIEIEVKPPDVTGITPEDGSQITTYSGSVSIDVVDPDFSSLHGDNLTVELSNSEGVVGNTTLSANGTANISYSALAGSNSLTWTVSDSYGLTASDTYSFTTPAELTIREETNTSVLVDSSSNLTLRFFGGDQIVERTTDDGRVSLEGLPATEEVVIIARADGYYSRRAVVSSLFEQQSVYMLSENETAVFNEFVVEDRVGRFSDNQTKLRIEKGITQNDSTEWKTLAGDYLGAGGSFALYLQKDARYRVYVESGDGEIRNLGPHIAAADGVVPVTVGDIEWVAPSGETYRYEARVDDDTDVLTIAYEDGEGETDSLSIQVYERGNQSNILLTDTASDPNSYQIQHQLVGNETETVYQIEVSAVRNGEDLEFAETVGGVGSLGVPIDSRWLAVGSLWLVVAIAALMPSTLSRVGAVGVVGVATGLSWFGWAPIPIEAIGIAGALALFGLAAQFGGR